MPRRRIEMKPITDKKARKDTFHKRKAGLIKKAAELSILCKLRMLLVFEDLSGEVIKYSTHGNYDPLKYFGESYLTTPIAFSAKHYPHFFKNILVTKHLKGNDMDSDDHNEEDSDDDQPLTESNHPQRSDGLSDNCSSLPGEKASSNSRHNHSLSNVNQNYNRSNSIGTIHPKHLQQLQNETSQPSPRRASNPSVSSFNYNHIPRTIPTTQNLKDSSQVMNSQYQRLQNQQMNRHNTMDLEVIQESISPGGSHPMNFTPDNSNARQVGTKIGSFKRVVNPRLKINVEEEENKRMSAIHHNSSLFTASPISYMSPGMNPNSFIYEFNDLGRGLTPLMTPGTKKSHFAPTPGQYNHASQQLKMNADPRQYTYEQPSTMYKFDFRNNERVNTELPLIQESSPVQNFRDSRESGPESWSSGNVLFRHSNSMPQETNPPTHFPNVFGFGMLNTSDIGRSSRGGEGCSNEEYFPVPRNKEDSGNNAQRIDLDISGLRLLAPTPLVGTRSSNNFEWLHYFYQKHSDRSMQDERSSFLNSKSSGEGGGDLSLSIAKSPGIMKKVKEN